MGGEPSRCPGMFRLLDLRADGGKTSEATLDLWWHAVRCLGEHFDWGSDSVKEDFRNTVGKQKLADTRTASRPSLQKADFGSRFRHHFATIHDLVRRPRILNREMNLPLPNPSYRSFLTWHLVPSQLISIFILTEVLKLTGYPDPDWLSLPYLRELVEHDVYVRERVQSQALKPYEAWLWLLW